MPANRYFIPSPLTSPIALPKDELRHLKVVMRARAGDMLEVVNGEGVLAICKVLPSYQLDIVETKITPPPPEMILAQGFIRPALLDWVIEKGTELGATGFWLFPGDLSEKNSISESHLERLKHLTISALKQCGRLYLPTIEILPPIKQWEKPPIPLFFGSLEPQAAVLTAKPPAIIAIGPEKGFSREEEVWLKEKLDGKGAKLNNGTLRAETAAVCALSLLGREVL